MLSLLRGVLLLCLTMAVAFEKEEKSKNTRTSSVMPQHLPPPTALRNTIKFDFSPFHPLQHHDRWLQSYDDDDCESAIWNFVFASVGSSDPSNMEQFYIPFLATNYKLLQVQRPELFFSSKKFNANEEYFGRYGQYTTTVRLLHAHLQEFWKLYGKSLAVGIHSEPLARVTSLQRALQYTYNLQDVRYSSGGLEADTEFVHRQVIPSLPGGFGNVVLTINAFAVPDVMEDDDRTLFAIGDGLLEFLESLGLGDVAVHYIVGHEFAHVVQFELDEVLEPPQELFTSERTRRDELEADAMAAYFLAHEEGRSFDLNLLLQVVESAYAIGDCDLGAREHHGTPLQRECAIVWGANLGVPEEGEDPLSPLEFRRAFMEVEELIIEAEYSVCPELFATADIVEEEPEDALVESPAQEDDHDEPEDTGIFDPPIVGGGDVGDSGIMAAGILDDTDRTTTMSTPPPTTTATTAPISATTTTPIASPSADAPIDTTTWPPKSFVASSAPSSSRRMLLWIQVALSCAVVLALTVV